MGLHCGAVVTPLSLQGEGSNPNCLHVWLFLEHASFLPQSKKMFHGLISVSKLFLRCKCVRQSVCTPPSPAVAWIGSSNSVNLTREQASLENGWKDLMNQFCLIYWLNQSFLNCTLAKCGYCYKHTQSLLKVRRYTQSSLFIKYLNLAKLKMYQLV